MRRLDGWNKYIDFCYDRFTSPSSGLVCKKDWLELLNTMFYNTQFIMFSQTVTHLVGGL